MSYKATLIAFLLLISSALFGNDGSYYMSGNHLIPMIESGIDVRKEILTIKRVNEDYLQVNVYYEFFNPGEAKVLDVGFEAHSPSGDVDIRPLKGGHPYMSDFNVAMNGNNLQYAIAIVNDSMYYKNGKFIKLTEQEVQNEIRGEMMADFFYAYHFKANFKKGLNTIAHSYRFKLSSSIDLEYDFNYILTTANRWGNGKIEDFSLAIDMGEFQKFGIQQSFFKNANEWLINGIGSTSKSKTTERVETQDSATVFNIQNGAIIFNKLNFKPKGEIFLYSERHYLVYNDTFNAANDLLPNEIFYWTPIVKDEFSMKVLRNLPYARRGYVFNSAELNAYFRKMDWYTPNPMYTAELSSLTPLEQKWLLVIKKVD
ncbi:MAG: YARHG domain-containing protein [Bacteroidota bacterium]